MTDPVYTPPRLRITCTRPGDAGTPQTVEIEVNDGPVTAQFVVEVLAALDHGAATTHVHIQGRPGDVSQPFRGAAAALPTDLVHLDGRLR